MRRSSHGEWAPAADRPDPVGILEAQAESRVPELVPIRHGRMLVSPFAFYRGAAAIMAADLDGSPDSGFTVQLCGDAHLANFGLYAAPDRRIVFDLNDFDETHPGPWEWDVKRLAASLEIAGRDRGFGARDRRAIVLEGVRSYREAMRGFAATGNLDVWYSRLDAADVLARMEGQIAHRELAAARRVTAKARSKDSTRAIDKLTTRAGGRVQFREEPPLLVRLETLVAEGDGVPDVEEALGRILDDYRASLRPELAYLMRGYRLVDIARKVVGVGSVGTRAWVILLEGLGESDALVLQAKEAEASVLERHLGRSAFDNHGARVVSGQRFMQAASDSLLGWQRVTGLDRQERDFYVRQLWDGKGSAAIETMPAERMGPYARLCGWTLARAHARSGDRVAIAAYLGRSDSFDRALVAFAGAYADQNERDHAALEAAVRDGRLEVVRDM